MNLLNIINLINAGKRNNKKQTCFAYCKCGNELISNDCLIKDTDYVYFKCNECGIISKWDFDCPCPILIKENCEVEE